MALLSESLYLAAFLPIDTLLALLLTDDVAGRHINIADLLVGENQFWGITGVDLE